MDIIESIMWVALGFVPTLAALEVAYRMGWSTRRKYPMEEVAIRRVR